MAKLVSMKIDRKAQQEKTSAALGGDTPDAPAYPYGLQLRLDDDALDKLGVSSSDYSAGDELMIIAKVKVSDTASRDSIMGGPTETMELQITDLCLEDLPDKKGDAADQAATLYKS